MKDNRNKKKQQQDVAKSRMNELFSQADKVFKKSVELANRYVELARKISLKYKVPFTKEQKMQFCKKCNSFLKTGVNSKIRVSQGKVIIHCKNCKNMRKFIYK